MSFIVLRRASTDRWETIGPRLAEMSEIEAEGKARNLARDHPAQEYAIAEITKIFRTQSQVVTRAAKAEWMEPEPVRNFENAM